MDAEPDIARVARTIGDPTRIRMLTLLMEGRALTAKELAHGGGVEPATATAHLNRLAKDGLIASTSQGRHKYFRLASPYVAQCVESLLAIALPGRSEPAVSPQPIRRARFCYDHLAGTLAIQMTDALLRRAVLKTNGKEFAVSKKGERWFAQFGIDVAGVSQARRRFAFGCLDWSERKDHVGGALGAAVAHRMLEAGWLNRKPGTRIATVTKSGTRALAEHFGIRWEGSAA
jgi:DNA-binding transcriptional ArsR family regulator